MHLSPVHPMSSQPPSHVEVVAATAAAPRREEEPDYSSVSFEMVDKDANGNFVGVFGRKWNDLCVKHLRTVCSRLQVRGVKNAKKAFLVEALERTLQGRTYFGVTATTTTNNTSEPPLSNGGLEKVHCRFRLINILFSERFSKDYAKLLGTDPATKEAWIAGTVVHDQGFWEGVRAAFVTPDETFDTLQFTDNYILASQKKINPGDIVNHDWRKLRRMWNRCKSDYQSALTRFAISDVVEAKDFYSFCQGNLATYYLRKHLEAKPHLKHMVEPNPPVEPFVPTDRQIAQVPGIIVATGSNNADTNGVSETGPYANKRKRTMTEEEMAKVAEAIRELGRNSKLLWEIGEKKLKYMEKEDKRREIEVASEELEKIMNITKMLREELQHESLDAASRCDIEADIAGLAKRKQQLSLKLGYRLE